jgi:hypothetical protein
VPAAGYKQPAAAPKAGCPISRALAPSVAITLDAGLL